MFGGIFKPKDLWAAAKSGSVKTIEELVANGHDIDAKKSGFVREGFTPIHIAVLHEQKEAIKTLVKLGADVNAKNNEGQSPLWLAVSELKHPDITELLLDLGAKKDLRTGDMGTTALDWAAFEGKVEMVRTLLKRGANPNAGRGSTRSAPIQHCANHGNVEILEMLLKTGADVHAVHAGSNALGTAALYGHEQFVKTLLKAGADPNQADESGTTPLMCGIASGKLEMVKILVEAGAKLNVVRFRGSAESVLDYAGDAKAAKPIADYLRSLGAKRASELPATETILPSHEEDGTFWQLRDDSVLEAKVEPWPPKSGTAKLKVEISPNGHDPNISFAGKLEYRVACTEDNAEQWKPMKRGRKDEDDNVCFSEAVTLTKGTIFIQFRVHPEWEDEATVLKDWRIEVS